MVQSIFIVHHCYADPVRYEQRLAPSHATQAAQAWALQGLLFQLFIFLYQKQYIKQRNVCLKAIILD